ncbi:hypothetical protein AB4259_00165 [Vibrio amylolyticus]|uniref:hypothetical protein n=1 Tax=Vibrio TaxID=662 RepID=UPI000C85C27E|nr:hypothetical protein [Vibrio sp. 10N.261.55.A7]PMJ91075.1 hypothetical protein BCU12_10910 [Vibrio sp. 10N.261.55.A7]
MVNEIWTSVKAYLYDRTSSPLLGALVTGWVAWNFKILMLFFSKADYAVKVWEIDHFYAQTFFVFGAYGFEHWLFSNYIFCVFIMPVATAAFYIYAFPWFSHKVFNHSYQKQIDLNNKKKEMQGSEVIDAEEKAEILGMYEEAKLETRELVVKHRQEIERLEGQLATVIQEKEDYRQQVNEILEKQSLKSDDIVGTKTSYLNPPENDLHPEKPSYIKFYERLDREQKDITQLIAGFLLQDNCDFDELKGRLESEAAANPLAYNISRLKSLVGQLKLYEIIDTYSEGFGESFFLTDNGKLLYRYILDNGLESSFSDESGDYEVSGQSKRELVEEIMSAKLVDAIDAESPNDYLKLLLVRLANHPTTLSLSSLASDFLNQGKAKMYLDKLVDDGLVDNVAGQSYSISKEVRTYVHA